MIKALQIVFFVLCIGGMLNAQEILLEEKFDDATLGVFTAYSALGDEQMWEPREFGGKFFAQMNGFFDGGHLTNEDWLISPALNMDVYDDEVLAFENANNFNGPDLELLVSTDYDGTSDPNTATWTDLSQSVTWSPGGYEYVDSGEIDLSSFSGTGYIAFKYISSVSVEGKLWQVDSIVVSASVLSNVNEAVQEEQLISTPSVNGDQLTFEVLGSQKEMVFAIYNMEGRLIQEYNNIAALGMVQLPVLDLASGMYILQVKSEQNLQAHKFMKL